MIAENSLLESRPLRLNRIRYNGFPLLLDDRMRLIEEAHSFLAARLRTILDDIAVHIGDPALNAAAVGFRLGLSARYIQQIVDGAGLSFSDYVRNLRLDRARLMLADPRYAHLRITDICAMTGFNACLISTAGSVHASARRRRALAAVDHRRPTPSRSQSKWDSTRQPPLWHRWP